MHVGCLQGLMSGMLVCQCCLQQCQLLMQSCRLSLLPVLLHDAANLFTKSPAVSVSHTCTMACKDPQHAVGQMLSAQCFIHTRVSLELQQHALMNLADLSQALAT